MVWINKLRRNLLQDTRPLIRRLDVYVFYFKFQLKYILSFELIIWKYYVVYNRELGKKAQKIQKYNELEEGNKLSLEKLK